MLCSPHLSNHPKTLLPNEIIDSDKSNYRSKQTNVNWKYYISSIFSVHPLNPNQTTPLRALTSFFWWTSAGVWTWTRWNSTPTPRSNSLNLISRSNIRCEWRWWRSPSTHSKLWYSHFLYSLVVQKKDISVQFGIRYSGKYNSLLFKHQINLRLQFHPIP